MLAMSSSTEKENARIKEISTWLYETAKPIRILSHVTWSSEVREQFLANKAQNLPKNVGYPAFDSGDIVRKISDISDLIDGLSEGPIRNWLAGVAKQIRLSALMLSSCGQPDFYKYSKELYGSPKMETVDGMASCYDLAESFSKLFDHYASFDLGAPAPACHLAVAVAERMQEAVKVFGDLAPQISIVDELSANALAGPKRIRIRKTACFTDLDIEQLAQHEVMIHVATGLNGHAQTDLPILALGHPGTTKTQEGLAVFAELITGTIDLDRFRRLADRVIAVQMAVDGADFMEVYKYFLNRTGSEVQAFENSRRVFRGGVLHGGAPFTKDIVYLDGLLRVHNFLRLLISGGRADCLPLLFVGKLDLNDLLALAELHSRGLCQKPKFLPKWVKDPRFLISYLGYSSFLNSIDLRKVQLHFKELISSLP